MQLQTLTITDFNQKVTFLKRHVSDEEGYENETFQEVYTAWAHWRFISGDCVYGDAHKFNRYDFVVHKNKLLTNKLPSLSRVRWQNKILLIAQLYVPCKFSKFVIGRAYERKFTDRASSV